MQKCTQKHSIYNKHEHKQREREEVEFYIALWEVSLWHQYFFNANILFLFLWACHRNQIFFIRLYRIV